MRLDIKKPFYHFSVDDIFDSLLELNGCKLSIFESSFFAFLQELHATHGLVLDLYLFHEKDNHTLKEIPDRFKKEFQENSWIRFGPHALNYTTSPFAQMPNDQKKTFDMIYAEIERFAGKEVYSTEARLHYFSESFELGEYFRKYGVNTLFTTDKPAYSYRMPDEQKGDLARRGWCEYGGIQFVRSQFRLENVLNISDLDHLCEEALRMPGFVVFFTHEVDLKRPEIQRYLERSLALLHAREILPQSA